jgi:L-fuculose-phosphate aldolase
LILARQIGPVQYYSDSKAAELLKLKPSLGVRDVRLEKGLENCDLCGNSLFREGYTDFKPEHRAFIPPKLQKAAAEVFMPNAKGGDDESLVQAITDQVMKAMNGKM